jgi:predicted nucleic acid-binding protein
MFYLDASVLVALHVHESHTERVVAWMRQQDPKLFVMSEWTVTEFTSALSLKIRTNQLTVEERNEVFASFMALSAKQIPRLPIETREFRRATNMLANHATGLRAGDALHLAIAATAQAVLVTLDRTLASAGATLGVSTQLL